MVEFITYSKEQHRRESLSVAVLNLSVRLNIVNATEMVKHVEINVDARNVGIRNQEGFHSSYLKVVNAEKVDVQKNIVNASKMVANADHNANV